MKKQLLDKRKKAFLKRFPLEVKTVTKGGMIIDAKPIIWSFIKSTINAVLRKK